MIEISFSCGNIGVWSFQYVDGKSMLRRDHVLLSAACALGLLILSTEKKKKLSISLGWNSRYFAPFRM